MKIKIYTKKMAWLIVIEIILIFSIANASLRFTADGMTSFYRLFSVLPACFIIIKNIRKLRKSIYFLIGMIIYSIIVSLAYYHIIAAEYYVFLIYMYFIYAFIYFYKICAGDFVSDFFRFIDKVTIVSIVLCFIQFFIRIPYPFVNLPWERGMNIYMWNENELAVPLACMALIYTYRLIYERKKCDLWKIISIIMIIYINDAKISLIGVIIGELGLLIYKRMREKNHHKSISSLMFTLLLIVGSITIIILLIIFDIRLKFRDYDINFNQLLTNHVVDIINLRATYGTGGSFVDRTNAIIFGLMELKNSHYLGIGLGNSVYMLTLPKYSLMTAASMHNFIFEMIVELGLFSFAVIGYLIKCGVKNIKTIGRNDVGILKIVFSLAFIFLSAQSSIGILSNYYMWIIVFYIFLLPTNYKNGCLVS